MVKTIKDKATHSVSLAVTIASAQLCAFQLCSETFMSSAASFLGVASEFNQLPECNSSFCKVIPVRKMFLQLFSIPNPQEMVTAAVDPGIASRHV